MRTDGQTWEPKEGLLTSFNLECPETDGIFYKFAQICIPDFLRCVFTNNTVMFNIPNPSSRTMALGSTQPLTETSTRNLPGK
jgi:hypothetical protein